VSDLVRRLRTRADGLKVLERALAETAALLREAADTLDQAPSTGEWVRESGTQETDG
jgi:hypothetical protein